MFDGVDVVVVARVFLAMPFIQLFVVLDPHPHGADRMPLARRLRASLMMSWYSTMPSLASPSVRRITRQRCCGACAFSSCSAAVAMPL